MQRRLHRWLSTGGMLLLFWSISTGIVTSLIHLLDPASLEKAPREVNLTAMTNREIAEAFAKVAASNALRSTGTAPSSVRIILHMSDKRLTGSVIEEGDFAMAKSFDVLTGEQVEAVIPVREARKMTWGLIFVGLHSGTFLGKAGQALIVISGLALSFMMVTGISMYLEMLYRRRRGGQRSYFWG